MCINRTRSQTIHLYHSCYQLRVKGFGELLFFVDSEPVVSCLTT